MLNVVMLSVIMTNVVMLSVIMTNVIMLSVIMTNVVMLSVIMLNVIMLSVVAPQGITDGGKKFQNIDPRSQRNLTAESVYVHRPEAQT